MTTKRRNIRISGFGGQGVILSGFLMGQAASLFDGRNAVFTQSYGPEARGGSCSSCVVIDEEEIGYPLVRAADYLIVLSKEGYVKYGGTVTPDGLTFFDSDLVGEVVPSDEGRNFGIPATRLAEELGKKVVANVIMLGFFLGITGLLSKEAIIESIRTSVKKDFVEINLKALERGYAYGRERSG